MASDVLKELGAERERGDISQLSLEELYRL